MKKFGRLILDLIIAAFLIAVAIIGALYLTKTGADNLWDQFSKANSWGADTARILSIIAIAVAAIGLASTAISIVLFFRSADSMKWTMINFIILLVAIGIIGYPLYEYAKSFSSFEDWKAAADAAKASH